MAIEGASPGVHFVLTGEHTKLMMWATLKVGIKMEARPGSLRMTRGASCKTRACKAMGISTRTPAAKVLELIDAKMSAVKVVADATDAATS